MFFSEQSPSYCIPTALQPLPPICLDEDADDDQDGAQQRKDQHGEDLPIGSPFHFGRLVDVARDRVEKTFHQPDVDPHGAIQIHQDQAGVAVQADER